MLDEKLKEKVNIFSQYIFNKTKGFLIDGAEPDNALVSVCAQMLIDCNRFKNPCLKLGNKVLNTDAWNIGRSKFSNELWQSICDDVFGPNKLENVDFSMPVLEEALYHPSINDDKTGTTPDGVIKLAVKIMELENVEITKSVKVADFGCGEGNFAIAYKLLFSKQSPVPGVPVKISSFDTNSNAIAIAKIRGQYLMKKDPSKSKRMLSFKDIDVFKSYKDFDGAVDGQTFDRIFAHYDWPSNKKLTSKDLGKYALEYAEDFLVDDSFTISDYLNTSSEWIFNHLIMNSLSKNGKAVVLMSAGALINKADKKIREIFLKNGWIERVIKLPEKLFINNIAPVYMVVLSNGNSTCKFVDARNYSTSGRRFNTLEDKDVESMISEAFDANKDKCFEMPVEMVIDNDSLLSAERYVSQKYSNNYRFNKEEGNNRDEISGILLDNCIKKVKRGAQISASALDDLVINTPTEIEYLRLKDLSNTGIPEELPYLKELKPAFEKSLLKDGDLVLTKSTKPFKVTVADIQTERKVLLVGNMYALELDRSIINPYYLQAFFESEKGYELIVHASAGSVVPILPLDMLKNIKLDLPSKEEQDRIALKYLYYKERANVLRKELEEIERNMAHVLD